MLRKILLVAALLCAPACSFDESGYTDGSDPPVDPPDGDEGFDGSCEDWTSMPALFDPCDLPVPRADLSIQAAGLWRLDTDVGTLFDPDGEVVDTVPGHVIVQPDGASAFVLVANGIRIYEDAVLRIEGSRPIIIASWTSVIVDGWIDVSSGVNGVGAGADAIACAVYPALAGLPGDTGGGGGGGGGFGGTGGEGGEGKGAAAGSGGSPPSWMGDELRGGCAGAAGGRGENGSVSGYGGAGGGALQLTARTAVIVSGVVQAGGSGGQPGIALSGGGGGGSGGMIWIEAPTVALDGSAVVSANGGGGGEGGDENGGVGDGGDDGLAGDFKPEGGDGLARKGGSGGDAGYADKFDGRNARKADAGGGGGGAAGVVRINAGFLAVEQGATISPEATD